MHGTPISTRIAKEMIIDFISKPFACATALVAVFAVADQARANEQAEAQQIIPAGTQRPSVGSPDFFSGRVRVEPVWSPDKNINASGGLVTFEPGARSAWHTHPAGQRLLVMSGVGLTQEWGKPIREIRAGDVVWCPPGVKHWHGASAGAAMTHLAITGNVEGNNVNWMEKVTDEQYNAR